MIDKVLKLRKNIDRTFTLCMSLKQINAICNKLSLENLELFFVYKYLNYYCKWFLGYKVFYLFLLFLINYVSEKDICAYKFLNCLSFKPAM